MTMNEIDFNDFARQASPVIVQLARYFSIREAAAVEAYGHIVMLRNKEILPSFDDCLLYLSDLIRQDTTSLTEEEVRIGLCLGILKLKQKPHTSQKVGRNEVCPCGSGIKFKHCCLAKDVDKQP